MEGDDQSSNYETYVSNVYDEMASNYERIYLKLSQYYRHVYSELYAVFRDYFNGVKIRSKILDLGSGTGIWTRLLRERGYTW